MVVVRFPYCGETVEGSTPATPRPARYDYEVWLMADGAQHVGTLAGHLRRALSAERSNGDRYRGAHGRRRWQPVWRGRWPAVAWPRVSP
jgi:hypothetical protein